MKVVDAVGNTLSVGDKCMHCRRQVGGNTPILKEVTVMAIHSQQKIEIRTLENQITNGRTYGGKLVKIIIEDEVN